MNPDTLNGYSLLVLSTSLHLLYVPFSYLAMIWLSSDESSRPSLSSLGRANTMAFLLRLKEKVCVKYLMRSSLPLFFPGRAVTAGTAMSLMPSRPEAGQQCWL